MIESVICQIRPTELLQKRKPQVQLVGLYYLDLHQETDAVSRLSLVGRPNLCYLIFC